MLKNPIRLSATLLGMALVCTLQIYTPHFYVI